MFWRSLLIFLCSISFASEEEGIIKEPLNKSLFQRSREILNQNVNLENELTSLKVSELENSCSGSKDPRDLKNGLVQRFLKRIKNHLILRDFHMALQEARVAKKVFPSSEEVEKAYIKALAYYGYEKEAISELKKEIGVKDTGLLEEIGWAILENGVNSTQYSIRLTSLVGAYLTRDARAVKIFLSMMSDVNAILRSFAVQFASEYQDEILKREIIRLFKEERNWKVRLEVIRAIGRMRIKEAEAGLKEIISSNHSTFEEKGMAIEALVNIYDKVDMEEMRALSRSPKAGLREFACAAAIYFELKEAKEEIRRLIDDPISDVRIAALNASILLNLFTREEMAGILEKPILEKDPEVAITAGWAALVSLNDKRALEKWLYDENEDNRRLASAALAASGEELVVLGKEVLEKSRDPYVKANVALGLIGQRSEIAKSSSFLFDFLKNKNQLWMWDNSRNRLFKSLVPSNIGYIDEVPNYPEAIDQLAQIELLSILAVTDSEKASRAIKGFLKQKKWGISGAAAALLLREGDEETLEVLRTLLKDKDVEIRFQAAVALAFFGKDDSALLVLQSAYRNADRDVKENILEALGNIGTKDSLSFFVDVLDESFQRLKIIAASDIIQCLNN